MAATARKTEQSKSGTFFDRVKKYFRGVWVELRKVIWPDRRTIIAYTAVVLVSVAFVALLIWIVDSGLSFILQNLLGV